MSRIPQLPAWLAHIARWQRGPLPWAATARSALGIGPALAAGVAVKVPGLGVLAALGAVFVVINDRIGSRRVAPFRLGGPALGGAVGLLYGSTLAALGPVTDPRVAVPGLALAGLAAGALGAIGPVASAAGTQLLVAAVLGAAMPLPGPGWLRAGAFLAGAGWALLLRVLLPSLRRGRIGSYLLDGERAAVAAAYDAVAEALAAAGTAGAVSARSALAAALDRAQGSFEGPRPPRRGRTRAAEERLYAQFWAVIGLAEATAALVWEGERLPERAALGPRRLAAAVRSGGPTGPLPAPVRSGPGLRALDAALLDAARVFGATDLSELAAPRARGGMRALLAEALRRAVGPSGREYGVRVALCTAASAGAALLLHPAHWYWLPVTVAFLVKPDLGPLVSRVVSRAVGTALGAVVFAGLTSVGFGGAWWLLAVVALCGALLPLASARHFAAQTLAVTVLVLCFVALAGAHGEAAGSRAADTLMACGIVLVVGHLPLLGGSRPRVAVRVVAAVRAAGRYLDHVVHRPTEREERFLLRRAAYRALTEARAAVELTAAELPPLAAGVPAWAPAIASLERIVDATTACAVRLDAGAGVPPASVTAGLLADFDALARAFAGGTPPPVESFTVTDCATLSDVARELHSARATLAA